MENTKRLLLASAVLMMATGAGAAGTAGATGAAGAGPAPAPTAPPASNPPTPPTTPTPTDTAAPSGAKSAFFHVKNTTARAITLGGVLLVPGAVTPVPNDKDGVNKRDADMDGLEIVSAPKRAGLSERGEKNLLEVTDVLHPDNSGTVATPADASGGTLYKPPEQIVKDAKASGWVAPGKS